MSTSVPSAEQTPRLQPHLVQLGLQRVDRALELIGSGNGGRDQRLPVRVKGWTVKGDLELHDAAGFVLMDQEQEGGGAVHRATFGVVGVQGVDLRSSLL